MHQTFFLQSATMSTPRSRTTWRTLLLFYKVLSWLTCVSIVTSLLGMVIGVRYWPVLSSSYIFQFVSVTKHSHFKIPGSQTHSTFYITARGGSFPWVAAVHQAFYVAVANTYYIFLLYSSVNLCSPSLLSKPQTAKWFTSHGELITSSPLYSLPWLNNIRPQWFISFFYPNIKNPFNCVSPFTLSLNIITITTSRRAEYSIRSTRGRE